MRTFRRSRWLFYVMSLCVLGSAAWFPVTIMAQVLPGSPFESSGGGGGATYPVSDEVFKVADNGDPTKIVDFELSGGTTGNTHTIAITGTTAASTFSLPGVRFLAADARGYGFITDTDSFMTFETNGYNFYVNNVDELHVAADGLTLTPGGGVNYSFAAGDPTSAPSINSRGCVTTLTAASATPFIEIAVPQGAQSVTGGTVAYTIRADDGTNFQSRSGMLVFAAVNPTGTEVCTLGRPDGGATVDNTTDIIAASSGTLTNTFTCTTGLTDVVRIAANAASSLAETTLTIAYEVVKVQGTGTLTCQ